MPKKRVLPKTYFYSMAHASLAELVAVYDDLPITAYQPGDSARRTPLFWGYSPDGLIEWLVAQGLDVNKPDEDGFTPLAAQTRESNIHPGKVRLLLSLGADPNQRCIWFDGGDTTPLHIAAFDGRGAAASALLDFGAEVDALNAEGYTPLALAMSRARRDEVGSLLSVCRPLIRAGATITPAMGEQLRRLGTEIEIARPVLKRERAEQDDAAFAQLVSLFRIDIPASPLDDEIVVPSLRSDFQHRALWLALVPEYGPATSVQGELIRISGRIAHEIQEMGGINWDEEYRAMLTHLSTLFLLGSPLNDAELTKVNAAADALRAGRETRQAHARIDDLKQAAINWIQQNPKPIPLGQVPYRR